MQITKVALQPSLSFTVFLVLSFVLAMTGVAISGLAWYLKLPLFFGAMGVFWQASRQPWQNLVIYPDELWFSAGEAALPGLKRSSCFSTAWFLYHPKVTLFFDQMPPSVWAGLRSYRK